MITIDISKANEQLAKLIDDVNTSNTPTNNHQQQRKKCCFNIRRKMERD